MACLIYCLAVGTLVLASLSVDSARGLVAKDGARGAVAIAKFLTLLRDPFGVDPRRGIVLVCLHPFV